MGIIELCESYKRIFELPLIICNRFDPVRSHGEVTISITGLPCVTSKVDVAGHSITLHVQNMSVPDTLTIMYLLTLRRSLSAAIRSWNMLMISAWAILREGISTPSRARTAVSIMVLYVGCSRAVSGCNHHHYSSYSSMMNCTYLTSANQPFNCDTPKDLVAIGSHPVLLRQLFKMLVELLLVHLLFFHSILALLNVLRNHWLEASLKGPLVIFTLGDQVKLKQILERHIAYLMVSAKVAVKCACIGNESLSVKNRWIMYCNWV